MRRYLKRRLANAASLVVSFFALLTLVAVYGGALGKRVESQEAAGGHPLKLQIPQSITAEHAELHEELNRAMRAGGETAKAAGEVERLLRPHFVKEEEYALPPLGLLASLAGGKATPGADEILAMTDRLKAELPQMLGEHRTIAAAVKRLADAAERERKPEHARFAAKLMHHAHSEEEVLYPAAILVGEYLRLKAGS